MAQSEFEKWMMHNIFFSSLEGIKSCSLENKFLSDEWILYKACIYSSIEFLEKKAEERDGLL